MDVINETPMNLVRCLLRKRIQRENLEIKMRGVHFQLKTISIYESIREPRMVFL